MAGVAPAPSPGNVALTIPAINAPVPAINASVPRAECMPVDHAARWVKVATVPGRFGTDAAIG